MMRGAAASAIERGSASSPAHHGWKFWQWTVDLVCALKLSPQSFEGQAGQGIRRSIRKNRRTDAKREMKVKTGKHHWASEPDKSPHRCG
jgi:hypothetical protein